jgi:NAD(P)-dependent dehydrogenase (short-subunit alcohol dehydrogenase family)
MKVQNKNVLITGGSAGLGRALALKLVNQGANVSVVARGARALEKLKAESPRIQTIRGDVTDKKDLHRIYSEALQHLGEVDLLINNASSLGPSSLRLLIDTDCEDLSLALATNLVAPFRLSKLVLSSMLIRQQGLIVNISSDAAIQNYPNWGAYSVSKSALDHLTRIFESELTGTGIRFLAIDPGDMKTALHLAAVPEADTTKLRNPEDSEERLIAIIESDDFSAAHQGIL